MRPEGIILTAYHVIKDAREVQVRLFSGEAYDQVELIGFDERRDVAALRLPAVGLAALPVAPSQEIQPGMTVYVISNPQALRWSVSSGVLSAIRLADEVPGAGSGYRLLQFTAPVSPGSSGGLLVDAHGRAVGLVVAALEAWQTQNLNFAVPLESVLGLADGPLRTPFGSGRELRPPMPEQPPARDAVAKADPGEILRAARTVHVYTKEPYFFPTERVEHELQQRPEFKAWGLLLVKDRRVADLLIELDRPTFTWDFLFSIVDPKTSVVLGGGKLIAFDAVRASGPIAKEIVKQIKAYRPVPEASDKKEKEEKKP